MKIKKNITFKQLDKYGWSDVIDEDINVSNVKYSYCIGHSRRGQFYYYLIMKDRTINIIATKPDGSGTYIDCDEVIIKMYNDGLIEFS